MNTNQSSQYLDSDSSRAIDGLKGPDPETCNCCSQTQNAEVSWWQVDMGMVLPAVFYDRRFSMALFNGNPPEIEETPSTVWHIFVRPGSEVKLVNTSRLLMFLDILEDTVKGDNPKIPTMDS